MPTRRSDNGMTVAIDGYEMLDEIGTGGFSVVYRARQQSMNRDVAIKVLHAGFGSDAERRTFERECHALGQLSHHPNIVTVFSDSLTTDGRPCIVMELYHSNYRERLEQNGPLSVDEAMAVAVRICGALHTAHEAGVLHRDLKPHNIFVSAYGEPALGDFGISTIADERSQNRSSGLSIAYAAPEVLEDADASVASDVYSTGITLYQLIAGSTPFAGPDLASTVRRILTAAPHRIDRPGMPPGLNRLLQDVLAKSPAERPQSMLEFAEQLRDVQARAGLTPTPIPRLTAGIADAVGTIARPPDTSGPSVISAPGAIGARPPSPSAHRDANATVARPVVARDRPPLTVGDDDPGADGMRWNRRRLVSVGLAAGALVAILAGVFLTQRGGGDDEATTSIGPTTTVPADDFFAILQPPGELLVARAEGVGYVVSYEVPEFATEVEIEVVTGAGTGTVLRGTGEPIEVTSDESSLCVVARSTNDSGQISAATAPICSG
jgi:hypothetical protein